MYIIKLKGIPSYEIHADQLWKYLNLWYDVVGFKPDYKKKCQLIFKEKKLWRRKGLFMKSKTKMSSK